MSIISDKQKLHYLFKRHHNLVSTDLDINNFNQPIHENRKYVMGREVLTQIIPKKPEVTKIDKTTYEDKYKISLGDFYKQEDTALKNDSDEIVLQVNLLKLQKIPNTANSWYYLDTSGNNFLSYIIPSNYGTKLGNNFPHYEINIYSKNGLDRNNRYESYLANEKIRTCNYIFDYNNGILILSKNLKDNNNILIDDCNPPYISFYKYTGSTLLDESVSSTGGSGGGLGGQWIKNDDDNSIYYKNGNVLIGTDKSSNNNYDLEISGNVYISNNLHVKGDQIIHDDLHIIDDISANTMSTSGNVDISGNLDVELDLTVSNDFSVIGNTVLQDVSGADASFNNMDICGNKLNAKNICITGNIYQNGTLFSSNPSVNNIGQSFFDILTQQPGKFKKGGSSANATEITLSWSYEDILANQTDTILAKLSFQNVSKLQNLPHINQIIVDISGTVGNNNSDNNTWLTYATITVDENKNYVTHYKSSKIKKISPLPASPSSVDHILSKTDYFDARVYGINYAENFPTIENRALIFKNLIFQVPLPPPAPKFISENSISSDDQLTYNYDVSGTEIGRPESQAVIISAISKYKESETLSSSIHTLDTAEKTDTENVASKNKYIPFPITLNNLRAGTKYNYKVQAKNNINNTYSDFSAEAFSNFLRLPGDDGISTTLNFNTSEIKTYISTPSSTANLYNSYVYYLNTANNDTFNLSNTNKQTIQISDPYRINQQNTQTGYGKWIDNSQNLVQVKCFINSTLKQTISFNGFDTTNNNAGTSTKNYSNGNAFNYFNDHSQSDIYSTANTKGFRIKGIVDLNHITSVLENIGPAQNDKHIVEYKYIRHADVGGSSTNTIHNVYIDTLSLLPSSSSLTSSTVQSVIYTMGIPSVKTFDISMNRTYNNINSTNLYIPGNGIIANITNINNTNKNQEKSIVLDRDYIVSTGKYTFDSNDIKTQTSSYYYGTYYTEEITGNSTTLAITEKIYSLKGNADGNNSLIVNNFFDKDSYNNTGGSSISRKFTYTDVYEITDSNEIAKLDTNVGGIGTTQYTSANTDTGHKKIPKDWTLLYLGGKFRTNANKTYPNINNYQYDGADSIVSGGQYSAGTIAYSTSGIRDDNNGYKWIVFKASKSSNADKDYIILGQHVSLKKNDDNVSYLDLKTIFNSVFISTTISKLFNNINSDAIGFCRATKFGTSTIVIGSFKQSFNTPSDIWSVSGTNGTTYENISTDAKYGAYVDHNLAGGIYISKTALNDDLEIFVGLKNSVIL